MAAKRNDEERSIINTRVINAPRDLVFTITRAFKAPIDLVFKMWSDPKHSEKWFGPKGSKMKYIEADIRPGGTCFYHMSQPGGVELYGKCRYEEIVPPNKMVWVQWFSNKEGGMGRHPMAPTWPREMHTTVTFSQHLEFTTVKVEWIPLNASKEELEMFQAARGGMSQGWSGSFDQLDQYLLDVQT